MGSTAAHKSFGNISERGFAKSQGWKETHRKSYSICLVALGKIESLYLPITIIESATGLMEGLSKFPLTKFHLIVGDFCFNGPFYSLTLFNILFYYMLVMFKSV